MVLGLDAAAGFVIQLNVFEPFVVELARDRHGVFDVEPVLAADALGIVDIGIVRIHEVLACGVEPVVDFFGQGFAVKLHAQMDVIKDECLVDAEQAAGDDPCAHRRDKKITVPLKQGHGRESAEPLVGFGIGHRRDVVPADFFVRGWADLAARGLGQQLPTQTVSDDGDANRHGFVD